MEQYPMPSALMILQRIQRIRQRRTLGKLSVVLTSSTEACLVLCQTQVAQAEMVPVVYDDPSEWKDFGNWHDLLLQ